MNYGALVFLGAFLAVSLSWFGMVLSPQIQLGRQTQGTNSLNTAQLYPVSRPGLAREGLEVYRANGCVYCHSQQVRQSGTAVNVILMDAGTNAAAAAEALMNSRAGVTNANAVGLSTGLPKAILATVEVDRARAAVEALTSAGAKAKVDIAPVGADIAWNWGVRRSVAHDYLYDSPVLLGGQRVGPDLANVGAARR